MNDTPYLSGPPVSARMPVEGSSLPSLEQSAAEGDAPGLSPLAAGVTRPTDEDDPRGVLSTLPWLWIAAWLIAWALLVALAAYFIDARAGIVWIWVAVWAVPGLVVSALLTRLAVQGGEREAAALRLKRAASDIATLEQRLLMSSRSMFSATQTLSDATQLLLEQVDTSRDDLRNQIGSARQLADALKSQTAELVSAQTGYRQTVLPEPQNGTIRLPDAAQDGQPAFTQPPLGLRPLVETVPGTVSDSTSDAPISPTTPLGLRSAPVEDEPVFETRQPDDVSAPDALPDIGQDVIADAGPVSGSLPVGLGRNWKWSDMLRTVDSSPAPVDSAAVLGILEREGLSPAGVVTDGTVQDAAGIWERQGLDAMVELLDIRIGAPASALAARMQQDGAEASIIMDYADGYGATLPAAPEQRMDTLMETNGRAWLIVKAAVLRLERGGA